jgi:hypothetical protein
MAGCPEAAPRLRRGCADLDDLAAIPQGCRGSGELVFLQLHEPPLLKKSTFSTFLKGPPVTL